MLLPTLSDVLEPKIANMRLHIVLDKPQCQEIGTNIPTLSMRELSHMLEDCIERIATLRFPIDILI